MLIVATAPAPEPISRDWAKLSARIDSVAASSPIVAGASVAELAAALETIAAVVGGLTASVSAPPIGLRLSDAARAARSSNDRRIARLSVEAR